MSLLLLLICRIAVGDEQQKLLTYTTNGSELLEDWEEIAKVFHNLEDAIIKCNSFSRYLYSMEIKNARVECEVVKMRAAEAELECKLHETKEAMQRQLTEDREQLAAKMEESELLRTEHGNRAQELELKEKESSDRGQRIATLEDELKRWEQTEVTLRQKVDELQQKLDDATESVVPVHGHRDTTLGMIYFTLIANSTLKWKNVATRLGVILGKSLKKELVMTLRNIELLSSCMSFSFTSRHFPAFLKCYKMGKTWEVQICIKLSFYYFCTC